MPLVITTLVVWRLHSSYRKVNLLSPCWVSLLIDPWNSGWCRSPWEIESRLPTKLLWSQSHSNLRFGYRSSLLISTSTSLTFFKRKASIQTAFIRASNCDRLLLSNELGIPCPAGLTKSPCYMQKVRTFLRQPATLYSQCILASFLTPLLGWDWRFYNAFLVLVLSILLSWQFENLSS